MSAIVRPRTSFVSTPRAALAPRQPTEPGAERGAPAVDVRGFNFWYGERQVLRKGLARAADLVRAGTWSSASSARR